MTDMHREAFERFHGIRYDDVEGMPINEGTKMSLRLEWERNFQTWQAALRYRDEQEKGDGTR